MYVLYDKNKGDIIKVDRDEVLDKLYYSNEITLPSQDELTKYIKKNKKIPYTTIKELKTAISKIDNKVPLYDVYTDNMYLINKHNVYYRVIHQNYRFPDNNLISVIKEKQESLNKKVKNNKENDVLIQRKLKKYELMLTFLGYFDMDELYNTYVRVFYLYANEVGKSITICNRPSFMPHFLHIKPYYTRSEVINMALNMGIVKPSNKFYEEEELNDLCRKIRKNDVSADTLLNHQKYIIKENKVGLIQYYSLHGSYHMNQYLRNLVTYPYQNTYLEELIKPMWELTINSPKFDKDYTLYRFVSNDSYLRHLDIGDIYTEKGFTSTTRDPFYRSDLYQFGFILIKINIPKNVTGVGLCIETLSHFPHEEEIILPPLSLLRLDKRDEKADYFNTDEKFASQVKTRYEFTYIGRQDISFEKRPQYEDRIGTIDFIKLSKVMTMTLQEKIRHFVSNYVNPMGQIEIQVSPTLKYTARTDYFDGTGAYKNFYALEVENGFSIYSIYNNYILFFIELGENKNGKYMSVNYYVKYSTQNRSKVLGDEEFIYFISTVANYFEIDVVILYADYLTCDIFTLDKKSSMTKKDATDDEHKDKKPQQLTVNNPGKLLQRGFSMKEKDINNIKHMYGGNSKDDDVLYGGSYCVDLYKYLKNGTKRYQDIKILNIELSPQYSYYQLDKMRATNPLDVLRKEDRDEIYQIYDKTYKDFVDKKDNNLAKFVIWIIENKCYLVDTLITKLSRIFKKDNSFVKDYYKLDPVAFLYNRRYISNYPQYAIDNSMYIKRNIIQGAERDQREIKISR